MKPKESPDSFEPASSALRELQAAREIAHAFLTARHPTEVYRLALEKVAQLVGATFGCVFLREEEGDLLRVVAAHNWPQAYASYLSSLRVRIGKGPTGRAVAENELVEVPDVFADPGLEDWWEPAHELDFASSVSVPLAVRSASMGALTFYFREPGALHESDRSLLQLVADQLAATAEKAHLIENLERANQRLREQNIELEAKCRLADEARRVRTEFLANVSHELRTPLTAVLGYAYLLREGISGTLSPEQGEAVDKIEGAGNTLMGLINSLLDLTHLTLGSTAVEPELCDAVALLRAALSTSGTPPRGVELRTEVPPDHILIHTDPVLVVRILQKLISNALKFTPAGTVTVRVRGVEPDSIHWSVGQWAPGGGSLVIWQVEDTGIGIAPSDQEAIFDEFRQVDGSATRRFGGTGLGLALSRGLARRLGGDIRVASELGQGSTFTLVLPAHERREDQEPASHSSSATDLAAAS